MLKNHFKLAWRNLFKNKAYSVINITGLTAGTVCFLYVIMYGYDQLGYDSHHENADHLYRICTFIKGGNGNNDFNSATASPPIAFGLKNDFPEVEQACRIIYIKGATDKLIKHGDARQGVFANRGYLADSTVFDIFTYQFVQGVRERALDGPNTIVLSSSLATKLFGDNNTIGEEVTIGAGRDEQTLTITGVFDENSGKSHLNPNYFISMNTPGLGQFVRDNNQWLGQNFVVSYIRLHPNVDASALERKFPDFLINHAGEDLREAGMEKRIYLQKVQDIHLYSRGIDHQIGKTSDIQYLILLVSLALFIQLIACINFINLSTAQSSKRSQEIGMRKVIGSSKNAIAFQFLGESVLIAFIATFIALPVCWILLPLFNEITDSTIGIKNFLHPEILMTVVGLGVFTGFIAGIYPALYTASIKSIQVIKRFRGATGSLEIFRRALVVFQFTIAIGLIAGVIIIGNQVKFLHSKDPGFKQQERIAIRMDTEKTRDKFDVISDELKLIPEVKRTAGSEFYPSENILYDRGVRLSGQGIEQRISTKVNFVTETFFETMGIPIISGRNLLTSDSNHVVVNELLLKNLQLSPQDAIGTRLFNTYEGETEEYIIVGVHKDYHYTSLKDPILPMMSFYSSAPSKLICWVGEGSYSEIVSKIESLWALTFPDVPFQYEFVDESVRNLYEEESRLMRISGLLTFLSILICCMGLFGLAMFVASQRTKEIGVRKVNGAKVAELLVMLNKDFVRWVGIAFIVATPVTWLAMGRWLENFAYRTEINWWIFLLTGLLALGIALLTVSWQSWKAATRNPVEALRYE